MADFTFKIVGEAGQGIASAGKELSSLRDGNLPKSVLNVILNI